MAAGSQGCNPNWADFPVAARINPSRGSVWTWDGWVCISQVLVVMASHAMLRIRPMSPIRLYNTA